MALGAVLEPLIVVSLLAFGTLVNRNRSKAAPSLSSTSSRPSPWQYLKYSPDAEDEDVETARSREDERTLLPSSLSRSSSSSSKTLAEDVSSKSPSKWRKRRLRFLNWEREVTTPNTEIFRDRFLSRVLQRFPFLVEVWYWALIYWVYQLGRAFTAVTLQESTVNTAREHGLQVIHLEQRLGMFVEPAVQHWFLARPALMRWTNKTYSFIHIPGTILYLIVLYHATTARPRHKLQEERGDKSVVLDDNWRDLAPPFGPAIYERRRRTMAMCNLLAFIVFTFWPCMPPRLLSDPTYAGEYAAEAKSFGFVDTVHGADGDSSVWTTNRFCNQYAAMPSLHFGYSFLIGLTIAAVPLRKRGRLGWRRLAVVGVGMIYPAVILTAIVATANHFILDAVAGAVACIIAWNFNDFLLNLVPLEDYFLAVLRIHKP
ncbi:PAP2 superfamily-domain-containing protein [Parachaetomium inaequale]|uniref:PAP2 superfamily-domain-containing protein n=1 Tax=Parachaetomium inaequale TaxID=2588326 RepID=A0AAN6PA31_9PEZI|nr:PAP2 superfamily-domain-containing protein [Parachaetomium inaequale]